jgi:hypothetical protein
MLVNPPPFAFGWMLIYLGIGCIAFAIFRHFRPARPVLSLTPAGVSFHRFRDLLVPWQDIQRVGPVELGGIPATNPNVIVVAVSNQFYEQHIAAKRSFFEPPGTEYMFRPIGEMMQVALTSADVRVNPEDYRQPAEAQWKAFRDRPRSAIQLADSSDRRVVFGRWSIDGSLRQAIWFAAPLVGVIAVVVAFLAGVTL